MNGKIRMISGLLVLIMVFMLVGCSSNNTISADSYYYDQLTDTEKSIYRNFEANEASFIEGKRFELLRYEEPAWMNIIFDEDMFGRAYEAYIMDNPLASVWCNLSFFNITIEDENVIQDGIEKTQVVMYINPLVESGTTHAFASYEEILVVLAEIEDTAKEFVSTLKGTKHEKIQAIYDWMTKEIVFQENNNDHNIYGALIKKEAVCYGIASGFKYLCDMAGINAICVIGEGHVWNYVQDDNGRWYLIDATWDLGMLKEYFLNDILEEMGSGERCVNQTFHFSYDFFYRQ